MAASYVLVSAAAVVLVEAVLLAVTVPRIQNADQAAAQAKQRAVEAEQNVGRLKTEALALSLATAAGKAAAGAADNAPGAADNAPGAADNAPGAADTTLLAAASRGFADPSVTDQSAAARTEEWADAIVRAVAAGDGRVIAASPSDALPPGSMLPEAARSQRPQAGQSQDHGSVTYWASAPIEISTTAGTGRRSIGIAYVFVKPSRAVPGPAGGAAQNRAPAGAEEAEEKAVGGVSAVRGQAPGGEVTDPDAGAASGTTVGSLVGPGMVVLVLLLPVGALFGLLSTGRLIRRVRRLSEGTAAMAGGDLRVRIPVSDGDEVGSLERAFNGMAERLDAAVTEQRVAAGAEARHAERNRIARELHDSISQDLFSVGLVAAGMRKALPPGSELYDQAVSMERSLAQTMREMRALLLQLRPVALEDLGLAAALEEVCRVYQARLGVPIALRVDPVSLEPEVEHAVLRVVQEAIGNAIRHGDPSAIELRLTAADGVIEVVVQDDGCGFDPLSATGRHGMGLALMRERMRELGGTVGVVSAPDEGTTITVSLPATPRP
jgi:signal transduction histidine kinase